MEDFFQKLKSGLSDFLPSHIIDNVPDDKAGEQSRLFRSVRVKLTLFYLAILILFCLIITLSLRNLAGRRFDRAGEGSREVFQHLVNQYYSVPIHPGYFNGFESDQDANVRHDLNKYVIIINVVAIAVGGIASYWYAGRTLKPIEEANKAQARFAADASHELRTPLTSIKTENEIFLRQPSFTNTEAKDLITSNLEEVQRLENLASNLLALSQYENVSLDMTPIKIQEIIRAATEQAEKSAKAKKIKLDKKLTPASVVGNFDSLVQLVGILLDNAIKYSPKGSKVHINGKVNGKFYSLNIRDEGPGISNEDLPYIFDRLYRGDKSRTSQIPGYGLGLALGREIAEANHAKIIAGNSKDGGAKFSVELKIS